MYNAPYPHSPTITKPYDMNKILFALLSFVGLLCFTSCSETDDSSTEYDNWQSRNDTYFEQQYQRALDSIAVNPTKWKLIKCFSKDPNTEGLHTDYIIVHVLSQKESHDECTTPAYADSPLYSDSVRLHLRGNLIPSASYNVESASFGTVGYQFDTTWYGDYNAKTMSPSKYKVAGLIDGFVTAVMNMHCGDRWEICIPYQLAYSSTTSGTIPAYSALIFDLTLHSFARSGQSFPSFQ